MLPLQNFCVSQVLVIFLIFFCFWPRKACCVYWYYSFFIRCRENDTKYPPYKSCIYISCSRHKIVWKLAYLSVRMMSLIQKQTIRKVSFFQCMKTVYLIQRHEIGKLPVSLLSVRNLAKPSQERKLCNLMCQTEIALVENDIISLVLSKNVLKCKSHSSDQP